MEAQQKREKEESLRVSLSDPFTVMPQASPVTEVETQKREPEPAPAPFFSAFRQLTPTGEVGEITVKNSDLYQWE